VGQARVELVQGNIVHETSEAIVNAANSSLLGGGGVDGAIHRAAGPELLAECRPLGGCPTGQAKITRGYRLPARHVIHAVGPVYHGRPEDATLLASAYRACLKLCASHRLASVSFPSISTGAYRFPLGEAAPIALGTVREHLTADGPAGRSPLTLVRFVLFDTVTLEAYRQAAEQVLC
jgi:O-acetyl-ADP-ribose deacetylase (regulator of RNase III)